MNISFATEVTQGIPVVLMLEDGSFLLPTEHPLFSALAGHNLKLVKEQGAYYRLASGQLVYLACIGAQMPTNLVEIQTLGGCLYSQLVALQQSSCSIVCSTLGVEVVRALAFGASLKSWRFETYHTQFRPLPKITCETLIFIHPNMAQLKTDQAEDHPLLDSIQWVRQRVNEPGNVLYPETFVQHIRALEKVGLQIEILDEKALKSKGFGALIAVGQGSHHPPYLAIMKWQGAGPRSPLAFVGKGVTFDSGGLSLKPSHGMEEMKMDMTGAAVVCGLMRALAMRQAPVNAVGVVALAENMPSGMAQRPGDIVTSLSGQTIEVLNTDAEGRLILADALWYTQDRFKPTHMIDVATLTGAIRIALGPVYAGLFSSDDALAQGLHQAGEIVGERLWRMPLDPAYDKELNSPNADIRNLASSGYGAGSSIGAQFLKRFVNQVPWAHLDIAAMDMLTKDTGLLTKGGTAFGLRLLDQWVRTQYV